MGYPQNPEILQGIYRKNFFDGMGVQAGGRFYNRLSMDIPQEVTTVTWTSFGSVPEPRQLSGMVGGGGGTSMSKEVKDWKLATTVQEHEVTVDMPRSVAEDNPADAGGLVSKLGEKAQFYYDRQFMACLTSTTLLGYDGVVVYSASHPESGTNQGNAGTSAGTPTAAQVETGLADSIGKILGFKDDQGTPVNEGVSSFTVLVNPLQYMTYKTVTDPTMSQQAVDSSGGTGVYRGMVTAIPSTLVTTKYHYVFANNTSSKAIGFFHKTDWDISSNMYTDSDMWQRSKIAFFTGYARFAFYPWNWKNTARYIFT